MQVITDLKNSDSSWTFQTPPSSPSSLGSRKSSMCSISSLNSSSSGSTKSHHSPNHHYWHRSLSQVTYNILIPLCTSYCDYCVCYTVILWLTVIEKLSKYLLYIYGTHILYCIYLYTLLVHILYLYLQFLLFRFYIHTIYINQIISFMLICLIYDVLW